MQNKSEHLFNEICTRMNYECICLGESKKQGQKTPDFRVKTPQGNVIAEVKEIQATRGDVDYIQAVADREIRVYSSTPGARIRPHIRKASKQLKGYVEEELPMIVILYDNVAYKDIRPFYPDFFVSPDFVDSSMFGHLTATVDLTGKKKFKDRLGKNKTLTEREKCYISAVCVISNADDHSFLVYHNPFAKFPLPFDIFSGDGCYHFVKPKGIYESPRQWEKVPLVSIHDSV